MPCFFTRWGEGPEQLESDKDCSDRGDLKGCKGLLSCGNMKKLLFVFFLFLLGVAAVHGEDGKAPRALSFDLQFCSDLDVSVLGSGCMDRSPRSCSLPRISAVLLPALSL